MGLVLPTPFDGQTGTPGPEWASTLNTALEDVDAHDHSDGSGAPITPAAMDINANLDMNGYRLTEVDSVELENQSVTNSVAGLVYRVGDNLYFNNSAGVPVQITAGTTVNASITNAKAVTTPGAFPYSVTTGDTLKVVLVDTSAARTINLPAATNAMSVTIKDKTGSAGTNNISLVPAGADSIDGSAATYALNSNWAALELISDGVSAWFIV